MGLGLSVDTALAAEYEGALLEHGIPAGMFHTREGRFSVFIDATHLTMQPSSYEPERGSFPFGGA